MSKRHLSSLLVIALLSILAVPGFAHEQPGPQGHGVMGQSDSKMGHMRMEGEQGMSCMTMSSSLVEKLDKMTCMLTGKMRMKPGMMQSMMMKDFYLNRITALGLQDDQVVHLKKIHADCRRDNLRTAAEVKIARFELGDLLGGDWTLETAEPLIRKLAKLEGDMKVRHLSAVREAFGVLTADQAAALLSDDSPESLFDD